MRANVKYMKSEINNVKFEVIRIMERTNALEVHDLVV
jgi:hypothetical protein